jgi:hypothetical protein
MSHQQINGENATDIVGCFGDCKAGRNLGGTTTVDNTVIDNQVPHDAKGIVKRPLGLIDNLFTIVSRLFLAKIPC